MMLSHCQSRLASSPFRSHDWSQFICPVVWRLFCCWCCCTVPRFLLLTVAACPTMASHWFGDRPALNGRTGAVYLPIWARFKSVFFFFCFFFKSGRYVKMADLFVRHLGYMKRVRRWLPYSQRFRREAITNSSIMQHLLCFWRRNLQQISYRYVFFYVCFLFNSFLGNVSTVSTKYLQGVITL